MTDEDILITVPMKGLGEAKQRLRTILNKSEREDLVSKLFENTLNMLRYVAPNATILVVTPCPQIARRARCQSAVVILESSAQGLNNALRTAMTYAVEKAFKRHLILPADIAYLNPEELRVLFSMDMVEGGVVLCPSKDNGTNALLMTPPDVLKPCFGMNSADVHQQVARDNNIPIKIMDLPDMSFDVDVPGDLEHLAMHKLFFGKTIFPKLARYHAYT